MNSARLCLMVYDGSEAMRARLRLALAEYSIVRDLELQVDWLSRREQESQLPRLAPDLNIALVNAGLGEAAVSAGQCVLAHNPDCLLVYYGTAEPAWKQLLAARPAAYQDRPESVEAWRALLDRLRARLTENRWFSWGGRTNQVLLPYRSIVYLQSDRSYIRVYSRSGASYQLLGKLDEAEKRLPPELFLRIHKSTLVNLRWVRMLDRSGKRLILEDNTDVFISRVHYKEVTDRLDQLARTGWVGL